MAAPDFKKFSSALALAIRAARADPDEDAESMTDFMHSTAHVAGNITTYRPFEAAASWLGSDPYLVSKGEKGVTMSDLEGVKAELRARQQVEDVRLGLVASAPSLPFFAGVAR